MCIEDIIKEYFENLEEDNKKLKVLSLQSLNLAMKRFVEKDDKDALGVIYK